MTFDVIVDNIFSVLRNNSRNSDSRILCATDGHMKWFINIRSALMIHLKPIFPTFPNLFKWRSIVIWLKFNCQPNSLTVFPALSIVSFTQWNSFSCTIEISISELPFTRSLTPWMTFDEKSLSKTTKEGKTKLYNIYKG